VSRPWPLYTSTFFGYIIPEVPCDAKLWQLVSKTSWEVARAGFSPPLTDFVIAACAQRARVTIVTYDKHFGQIPGTVLRTDIP
jgi:predicted nucleic acid-binding protein